MSRAAAVTLAAVLILACIALISALLHAKHRTPYDARHAFTDPADVTDPDGTLYLEALTAPRPSALITVTGTADAAALARVRGALAALPPGPPVLTGTVVRTPDPDDPSVTAWTRTMAAQMDVFLAALAATAQAHRAELEGRPR